MKSLATILVVAAIPIGATPAFAQHMNAKDAPCREARSGVETTNCFFEAFRARDSELAELLKKVRPAVGGDELRLLNRAQSHWTDYRTFQCDGERAMYEGGSAASMVRLACLEALTRDRIKQLHEAYDWRIEKHQWWVDHPDGRP